MKTIRFTAYPKPGDRFGRLVVLERIKKEKKHWHIRCLCDCGTEKLILQDSVIRGVTQSCGCMRREFIGKLNFKHGDCKDNEHRAPEYGSWAAMIQRCTNPKNKWYHRYGGRGIRVCDEWLTSYESFLAHIGRKPSQKHSIERIRNDGDYEPGNVKWATQREQQNNRSSNRFLDYNGKRQSVADWSRETGIGIRTILSRLRYGWSEEKTLTCPIA